MENIEKSNKLIAKFMGEKPVKIGNQYSLSRTPWIAVTGSDPEKVMDDYCEATRYHESWDWLMPVIEKVEGLKEIDKATGELIAKYRFSIGRDCVSYSENSDDISQWGYDDEKVKTKLELAYLAVIEFLIWHKENKGV